MPKVENLDNLVKCGGVKSAATKHQAPGIVTVHQPYSSLIGAFLGHVSLYGPFLQPALLSNSRSSASPALLCHKLLISVKPERKLEHQKSTVNNKSSIVGHLG